MRSARKFLVIATCSAMVTLATPAISRADPWGVQSSSTGAHPDGSTHGWCYGPGFDAALQDNAQNSFANALDAPTDAGVTFYSTCDTTDPLQTDVRWLDADLPAGTRGKAPCVKYLGDGNCDRYDVTLDPVEINIGSNDEADTTKTTCHELGHSVGLTHGAGGGDGAGGDPDDCMISGERPNSNLQYERYGTAHHVGVHINGWF
jgi:hypothetical protein